MIKSQLILFTKTFISHLFVAYWFQYHQFIIFNFFVFRCKIINALYLIIFKSNFDVYVFYGYEFFWLFTLVIMLIDSSILKGEAIEFLTLILHFGIVFSIWVDWTVCEILIKIRCICIGSQNGHEGSFNSLCQEGIPVHLFKPRVVLYLVWTIGTKSVLRIFFKQSLQDILKLGRCLHETLATFGTWRGWYRMD